MATSQSTQFVIDKLLITSTDGKVQYDIVQAYEEINIFDCLTLPAMSGNILLRDSVGLSSKIKFDGSEFIHIKIMKDSNQPDVMWIDKKFRIYKKSDRQAKNQTSETYVLHFVSDEFNTSKQKKVTQAFKGTYSQIVQRILMDQLGVENVAGQIGKIEPTSGLHDHIVTNLSPMDAIEQITKRAVSSKGLPDYVFFQNLEGYNFVSLSTLNSKNSIAEIEFGTKNLSTRTDINSKVYGARDVKISTEFNYVKNIEDGVYAGKFIGYDTLTRTLVVRNISFGDMYNEGTHANDSSINTKVSNKDKKPADKMYDSRITLYPFQLMRTTNDFLKGTDPVSTNNIDDTHNYIFQRRAIFTNLFQKKLRVTMPGNFRLWSGATVTLNLPNRFSAKGNQEGDQSVRGKYIIVATRHIIRFDKHETILEVATDSTNLRA